ncbi:MAG: hypothetical protein COV74_10600 [Candidatus Omnitrophica bacterium CG11_big_fil_rev_8_21_14_0_20_45_26]|uniref:Prepilin-type N-terminal cleavage/methylation domain-containing protein n=1 Tax=Candidatus Abzuiibacterium crystallinum TaxID=1974748 RepID=A0A2H0LKV1_9BACT|nr:MAG: hypothetical protein COV74_10600 [Candidatus Omnitrophica bacterium CG11_big_fil_rev_8_21_14_0_20_45_26]PIW63884.1 MAG: hypothetical protein COW12_08210 [Candidatus Omnitrophica bacterium CG12_big_fil_rev_8_21_14_0_65_45_16]
MKTHRIGKIKRNPKKGFTLVEVLLAISIIALIIMALVSVFYYTMTLHRESASRSIAMNDAIQVVEQCRFIADTVGLSGTGSVTDPNVAWSDLLSNLIANETVQVSWTGTDPLEVVVTVAWLEHNRNMNVSMTTLLTRR